MPVSALQEMGLEKTLEHVNVPSYVIDTSGIVRWLNPAAESIVGDVRGRQFTSVVAPEDTRRARELFARKVVGAERVTDAGVAIVGADGGRMSVEVSSVPVFRGEHVVGVFGQVSGLVEEPHAHPDLNLTPRQAEVLELLERGRSTAQIAGELHLSTGDCAQPHPARAARHRCPLAVGGGRHREWRTLTEPRRAVAINQAGGRSGSRCGWSRYPPSRPSVPRVGSAGSSSPRTGASRP